MSGRLQPRTVLVAWIALSVVTLLFHRQVLGSWWLSDDPQVLLHARMETPGAVLFSPPAYRYLSSASFTPLVTISFDLDHALAGMRPGFFYGHQLLAIALSAGLLFLLLARAVDTSLAFLGSVTFILAPSTVVIARGLMLRHYAEGMLFALISLLLMDASTSEKKKIGRAILLSALAALAYLLAMLCKEFYAPLPLLMLAIAYARQSSVRSTIVRMLWPACTAVVYLVWRWLMLGSGGGYGESVSISTIVAIPRQVWIAATGLSHYVAASLAGLAATSVILYALWKSNRTGWVLATAGAGVVLLPLLVLASVFEERYAFVASTALIAALTLSTQAFRSRRLAIAVLVLTTLMAAMAGWKRHERLDFESTAIIAEGHYVWSREKGAKRLLASSPGWYLEGLKVLRQMESGGEAPGFLLSLEPIVLGELNVDDVLISRWGTGEIIPLEGGRKGEIDQLKRLFDPSIAISLKFIRRSNELAWEVGPAPGAFHFFSYPYYGKFAVPVRGVRRLPQPRERQYFRLRRELPGGAWTISPALALPEADGAVTFSGPDGKP